MHKTQLIAGFCGNKYFGCSFGFGWLFRMEALTNATNMTRKDEGIGEGQFDSIAWLFECHVTELNDDGSYNSAIVHCANEDYPEKVFFYRSEMPLHNAEPDLTWTRKNEEA